MGMKIPEFQDLWNRAYAVPGHFNLEEARLLYICAMLAALKHPELPILEIGSFRGRSSMIIAEASNRQLILVEPSLLWHDASKGSYDGTSSHGFRYTDDMVDEESAEALRQTMAPYDATIIQAKTKDAGLIGRRFSMIFIDGNHTEGGIDVDCELALPCLVAGGIACFHDYDAPDYPFVKKTVDHYTSMAPVLGQQGSLLATYRW